MYGWYGMKTKIYSGIYKIIYNYWSNKMCGQSVEVHQYFNTFDKYL